MMTFKYVLLFEFILFKTIAGVYIISSNSNYENESSDEFNETLKMLENGERKLKSHMKSIVSAVLPYMMRIAEDANISSSCINTGILFLEDLTSLKRWTLQLLDSFGRPSAGILKMSPWIQGDYDQCLDLKIPKNIYGKYCAILLKIPTLTSNTVQKIAEYKNNAIVQILSTFSEPIQLELFLNGLITMRKYPRFDVCIPNTCSDDDVENAVSWLSSGVIDPKIDFCKEKERNFKLSTAQLICISALGFFVAWIIAALLLEIILKLRIIYLRKEGTFIKYVLIVSPLKSIPTLFTVTTKENTRFLCGMRIIIIFLSILAHQKIFIVDNITIGEKYSSMAYMEENFREMVISNGIQIIETFFFISGFTFCYLRNKTRNNSIMYYVIFLIKRIIRLTIPIFVLLAIQIILPLCGDGPHWELIVREGKFLERNWWKYVLHIQNFYDAKMNIVNIIWFLNVMMQLTIITVPLQFIQDRWPRIGNIIISILIVVGIVFHASDIYIEEYSGVIGLSVNARKLTNYLNHHYWKPYNTHMSTYLFGILIGYYTAKNSEVKFGKKTVIFAGITSFILVISVTFSMCKERNSVSPNEKVFLAYQSLAPFAWTVGIAWICVACITGYGGIFTRFLSAKIFVILNHLAIWIYLLHYIIIGYIMAQERKAYMITGLHLYESLSFIICLTIIVSIIVYVCFEYPINQIVSNLFPGTSSSNKTDSQKEIVNLEIVSGEQNIKTHI